MKRPVLIAALLIAPLALSACGGGDDGRTAGGLSENEAKDLDDAAEMLDERKANLSDLAPEQPPADQPASDAAGQAEQPQ